MLKDNFHIVTPIIDGHGENADEFFISIENSAGKLLEYIERQCNGKIFALGGLSIGGLIVTEALSTIPDITQFAIIESALVLPIKWVTPLIAPSVKLFYGLVKKRWFAKLQAKKLFVSEDMFEQYYKDSSKISKQSLININLSNYGYVLKSNIEKTKTKTLIIAGDKELSSIKKSAIILNRKMPDSTLYLAQNMGHGELSLANPKEYVRKIREFFSSHDSNKQAPA